MVVFYLDLYYNHPQYIDDFENIKDDSDNKKIVINFKVIDIRTSQTKEYTLSEYNNYIKQTERKFNLYVNVTQRTLYFIVVIVGMAILFWVHNGIKGKVVDRRRLIC